MKMFAKGKKRDLCWSTWSTGKKVDDHNEVVGKELIKIGSTLPKRLCRERSS
jgi:hypothetical protein